MDAIALDSIGQNIRKYRKARQLRQEDLAELAGLSPNYIGLIERGEKSPSLEAFIAILNALDISADMVMSDVLKVGYTVKASMLNEKLQTLSKDERDRIFDVISAMLKHA